MLNTAVRDIGLAGIAVAPDRMRALRSDVVNEIAASMRDVGLLQPIVLRPTESLGYYLVAGRHRYEAAKRLKWLTIRSIVVEGVDADWALLAEIDENLKRADLGPAEQAAHHAARKRLHLKLYPQTKHGGAPGKAGGGKKASEAKECTMRTFATETATKTGKHPATVRRSVHRGEHIPDVAGLAGTSLDEGKELDAMAKLSPDMQVGLRARAIAGEKVSAKQQVKKAARADKEQALAKETARVTEALSEKLYSVILIDCPWKFQTRSEETGMDRAADNHYPTMTIEALQALTIPAAKNCVLFMWATAPMLFQALLLMRDWGFDYRSNLVWTKPNMGTGYWFRSMHEHLLLGVKGDVPAPAMGDQFGSVHQAKPTKHSEKPACFHEIIEEYFPNQELLEMFARSKRAGWTAWGLEAPQ